MIIVLRKKKTDEKPQKTLKNFFEDFTPKKPVKVKKQKKKVNKKVEEQKQRISEFSKIQ